MAQDSPTRCGRLAIAVTAALSAWAWGQTVESPVSPCPFDLPASRAGAKLPSPPAALSPDSTWAAVEADKNIVLHNAADGQVIRTLNGPTAAGYVRAMGVAVSPDGKWIAATYSDNSLRVWNVQTGKCLELGKGTGLLQCLMFSPDSSQIAAVDTGTKKALMIWPVAGGAAKACDLKKGSNVTKAAFTGAGKTIATIASGSLALWDVKALTAVAEVPCRETNLASLPAGDVLVTFGTQYGDSSRLIWRKAADGAAIRESAGPSGSSIHHLAVCPAGDYIAAAGTAKEALVWEAAGGSLVLRLPHEFAVTWVEFGPGGKTLVTYSDKLHFWDLAVLADVKKRPALVAYFDGEADNYARYIRGYLADRADLKPIPYTASRAGYVITTITDRTGAVVEVADLRIGNSSVKDAIPMRFGATRMSVHPNKLKSMEFLGAARDGIRAKVTLNDGSESNGVLDPAQVTGQGAFGPVQCAMGDLARIAFDFTSAQGKPQDVPPPEDRPGQAELADVGGVKLSVVNVQFQGGRALPLLLGRLHVSLGFKLLRKIEVLRVQSAGVIVKAALAGDQTLVGFVPTGPGDLFSGKVGLGNFSLEIRKTKSVTFR
jgi:WD40 repeat protein